MKRIFVEHSVVGFVVQVESPDPSLYGGYDEYTDIAWYRHEKNAKKAIQAIRVAGVDGEVVKAWFPANVKFQDD